MLRIKHFTRAASNLPKFIKTTKILKHFDDVHRYKIDEEVVKLRKTIVNELETSKSYTNLDIHLCSKLNKLSTESYLALLNSWGSVRPDILTSTVFYKSFLQIVKRGLWKNSEWNHLVQIIHFVGYLNDDQDSKALMIYLVGTANGSLALPSAHYKDVCIICEACFRTSTAISSTAIRLKIANILEDFNEDLDNSIWLVMLLKILMSSKYFDYDVLIKLANNLVATGKLDKMAFTCQCYILALFSNAAVLHEEMMNILAPSVACKMTRFPLLRVKDVSMFLWALSSLDYSVDKRFLNDIVVPFLMNELNGRISSERLGILIQCSLSLWMLGVLPINLLNKIITVEYFKILKEKNKNLRDLSRLALLLSILEVENSRGLTLQQLEVQRVLIETSLLVPSLQKEVEKRPHLDHLCKAVREAGAQQARLNYPILIYIAGVSGAIDKYHIHLDLLDPTVCLAASETPAGRIKSKVKLLKKLEPGIRHTYVLISDLPKLKNKAYLYKTLGIT